MSISVVINTLNEAENLPRALSSVKNWADEIVVVDMQSDDATVKIARKAGAVVHEHKRMGYVEPARNYGLRKAAGPWILILDADEEVPRKLQKTLSSIAEEDQVDYIKIPRKNIIFGSWVQHARWWPDYNIRFFKKGSVTWKNEIHSEPQTDGKEDTLDADEDLALTHYHYQSIEQFVTRLNRYTTHQLPVLQAQGYTFQWQDLIIKPVNEFLSRYFAGNGYRDGLHGLALSLLQAVSEFVLYLKAWEDGGFRPEKISMEQFDKPTRKAMKDVSWWIGKRTGEEGNRSQSLRWKVKQKLL